jgi:hypothetical protein
VTVEGPPIWNILGEPIGFLHAVRGDDESAYFLR